MNEDLNRRVAEALSYVFTEQLDPMSGTFVTIIWRPDDSPFVVPPSGVWWDTNAAPELLDWSGDANAALDLALTASQHIHINKRDDGQYSVVLGLTRGVEGIGPTIPAAICETWLTWKLLNPA